MKSKENNYESYSVLVPVYYKDNPEWLKISLDSMLAQTVVADEFVIIKDGPLTPELDMVLSRYKEMYPELFHVYSLPTNQGLGKVLAYGIMKCRNELIARMDADDYSVPQRCEKQLKKFKEDKSLHIVGSNVEEFSENINRVVSRVKLPEAHEDAVAFAKKRCPIRHPALMYRRSKVLEAGNYRDYRHAQDYNLIVHMILSGARIYNIQENLTYMRVTEDFYKRRGGLKQLKLVLRIKKDFLNCGFYSFNNFFVSAIGNAAVCLMPNLVRELFYKKLLRK